MDMTQIKSRYNRILKLVRLSCNIVNEFGFRYFINIALDDLKKYKFKVFSPEPEQTKSSYSEIQDYKIWIRNHQITKEKKLTMVKELEHFNYKPKIGIILLVSENNVEYLKGTISSVIEQIYEKWEMHIFIPKKLRENNFNELLDFRITIHSGFDFNSLDKILASSVTDFTSFVKCGDILTENAFFRVIQMLNEIKDTDLIYFDEDTISDNGERSNPFFKPDWSPDLFLNHDYISHFYLVKTQLFNKVGGFKTQFSVASQYEFLLRITELTSKISHISSIGISLRKSDEITDESNFFHHASKAIAETLSRRGIKAKIATGLNSGTWRIKYDLGETPKVSIIIPTKDQKNLLKRCIKNIERNTSYKNYEIIIVDNQSVKEETISYFNSIPHTVIRYELPFNFSKINNKALSHASGDLLLFLNDDTAPLESNWLSEMVSVCLQDDVGVVGSKLVLANNTIQHAGIALLKTGAGFHPLQGIDANNPGYFGLLNTMRNCSAVTGACLLIRRDLFVKIGRYDEDFDLYYGDVDLCLKVLKEGYRVVYTPYAKLLHQGSSSIKEHTRSFFAVENHYHFIKKWPYLKKGDPFYNPNLTLNYRIDTR